MLFLLYKNILADGPIQTQKVSIHLKNRIVFC